MLRHEDVEELCVNRGEYIKELKRDLDEATTTLGFLFQTFRRPPGVRWDMIEEEIKRYRGLLRRTL